VTATSQPQTEPVRGEVLPPLAEEPKAADWLGYLFAAAGALVSALYLANLGAGFLEFGPDNLPGVGNLDEVFFSFLLLYCLRKLGIDPLPLMRRSGSRATK
jgi:hypothetical protein